MNRGRYVALVGVTGLTVLVGGAAIASIPDPSGTIHACYQNSGGSLRVVDTAAAESCDPASEQALSWSQTGPAGQPGPKGDAGPAGASGGVSVKSWSSKGSLILAPDPQLNGGYPTWSIDMPAGYWVYSGSVVIGMPQVRDRLGGPRGTDGNLSHHHLSVDVSLLSIDPFTLADGDSNTSLGINFSSIPAEADHVPAGQPQTLRFAGDGYLAKPGKLRLGFFRQYAERSTFEISDLHVRAIRYADYTSETIQLPTRPSSDNDVRAPAVRPPDSGNGTVSVAVKGNQRSALAALAAGPRPQTKARIVLLANRGVAINDIAAATFTSPTFVRGTLSTFKRSGLRALKR